MGGRTLEFPCCTTRGSISAFDLHTGERKWKTYTIDQRSEFVGLTPNGVNRYGPSGVTVFSAITVDEKRGLLYVPTANQQTEPVIPESDAVIALDIKTGAKVWVRGLAPEQFGGQDVYHLGCEAWVDADRKTCSPLNPKGQGDRDIVAPVILVERADGKEVLMAGSKDGMLYALDPTPKEKSCGRPASAGAGKSAASSGAFRATAGMLTSPSRIWMRTCSRTGRSRQSIS